MLTEDAKRVGIHPKSRVDPMKVPLNELQEMAHKQGIYLKDYKDADRKQLIEMLKDPEKYRIATQKTDREA